ncbi:hypothetical protein G7Y29_10675 (plasmid) [Corynebacterium qintianiae]|uniref:ParB n=1 Tax=Corynebacterium qintianiae TaxID=2709392 RepID=A0A7T0PFL5_9CORY|nr:hypothetical protein [Corynebacterium qintianiae]QPK84391.1 hypothetical protein G7Y29_10675 [Corynebacterium qintianiae]
MAPKRPNRLASTLPQGTENRTPPKKVAETLRDANEPQLDRRTTIYLSSETWREAKIAALDEGTNISQIIEKLLKDYLTSK